MKRLVLAIGLLLFGVIAVVADDLKTATLYKTPRCQCCEGYANYLRSNRLTVKVIESRNMSLVRKEQGVPRNLVGCHTTVLGGYVVEGHVPFFAIKRLLVEKPAIKGISLPGMPDGSPGMTGTKKAPFAIFAITGEGEPAQVYATE